MSNQPRLSAALAIAALLPFGAMAQTVGSATWYGARGQQLHTASGDRFDEEGMTAASNQLPMGSRVRVTVQDTGASVVVRINDRIGGRGTMIDLTKGAARQIGLLGRGRAEVSVAPTADEPVEVAEATEDETADIATDAPRGPRHMRRAGRWAATAHRWNRAPSVILARHSVQPRATRHRL